VAIHPGDRSFLFCQTIRRPLRSLRLSVSFGIRNAPNRAPCWCDTKDSCSHVALPSRPFASIRWAFDPSVRDCVRAGREGRPRAIGPPGRFRSLGVLYWLSDPAPRLRRRGRRTASAPTATFLGSGLLSDFEIVSMNPAGCESPPGLVSNLPLQRIGRLVSNKLRLSFPDTYCTPGFFAFVRGAPSDGNRR
jgi:hypothetical protein